VDMSIITRFIEWLRPYLYYYDQETGSLVKAGIGQIVDAEGTREWFLIEEETGDTIPDLSVMTPDGVEIIDRQLVYQRSVKAWGVHSQMDMLSEESAELIQAVSKYNRAYDETDELLARGKIIEEMADVYNMMAEARYILNISQAEIDSWREAKIERVCKHLEADGY
jgi:NTP pyrophosphatase (non-canonical NTP hydrolase)